MKKEIKTRKRKNMEATHYKIESTQMIEVEIYETGEKTLIAKNKITNHKNKLDRPIIITAAEYKSYKANILNHDM